MLYLGNMHFFCPLICASKQTFDFQFMLKNPSNFNIIRKKGRPSGVHSKKQTEIEMLKENARNLLGEEEPDKKPDLSESAVYPGMLLLVL